MGRTVPTYRMTLEGAAARFAEYRRALREADRRAFDRLIDRARAHSSAASYEASLDPHEVLFLSVLLDQELEIARLQRAVEEISWSVLGRPAGSSGTIDAFAPRRPKPPVHAAEGDSNESLPTVEDSTDPTPAGWNGASKEDGRRASSGPKPDEELGHARLAAKDARRSDSF
jgi:hypothetical protein